MLLYVIIFGGIEMNEYEYIIDAFTQEGNNINLDKRSVPKFLC